MTYTDLVRVNAKKNGYSQKVNKEILETAWESIKELLANGDDVSVPGFAKFSSLESAARKAHNPQTGEEMMVPAHMRPHCKFSTVLKKLLRDS